MICSFENFWQAFQYTDGSILIPEKAVSRFVNGRNNHFFQWIWKSWLLDGLVDQFWNWVSSSAVAHKSLAEIPSIPVDFRVSSALSIFFTFTCNISAKWNSTSHWYIAFILVILCGFYDFQWSSEYRHSRLKHPNYLYSQQHLQTLKASHTYLGSFTILSLICDVIVSLWGLFLSLTNGFMVSQNAFGFSWVFPEHLFWKYTLIDCALVFEAGFLACLYSFQREFVLPHL